MQGRIQENVMGGGGGGHNKCLSHDHAVSAILEDPNQHRNASSNHAPDIWGTPLRVWMRSRLGHLQYSK